jgi:hypothetical protein
MTIFWVALATLREAARGRALRGFVPLATALLAGLVLLPAIAPADKAVLLARLSLGAAGWIGAISLAFVGSSAISRDIEGGRIVLFLSKPISRAAYVAGRALGIALLAPIVMGALFGVAALAFYASTGRSLPGDLALTHPEREIAGEVVPVAGAVEWRFDREALAARPSGMRLRVEAEDPRIPRVPVLLELSSDAGPREEHRLLAGTGVVRDMDWSVDLASGTALRVRVTPRDGGTALRANPEAAVLRAPARVGFGSNFALGFLSLACAAALAGVVAVSASAALGGRLALLFALALLVAGSLPASIRAYARLAREGAPALAIAGVPSEEAPAPPSGFRVALGIGLEAVADLVPDLSRFDLSGLVVAGRFIPASQLARNGSYALLYACLSCALGCIAFSRRECMR